VGLVVGFLGALLGIGGGSIMIPILVLYFKYPIHTAIATSLVAIITTSTSAVPSNIRSGLINIKLGIVLELTTALLAIAGSLISISLNEKYISIIFSIILFIVSYISWKKRNTDNVESLIGKYSEKDLTGVFDSSYYDANLNQKILYKVKNIPITMGISGLAGLMSGMLGIGGGIFKVPAMNVISKIPVKVAMATSNFMIGFTASAGALVFFISGYVDVKVCSFIILGIIIGAKVAVWKFKKVSDSRIKKIFILFLLFIAVQMLIKGIG
jgi:uncharacterized membrane protein YfcA